MTCYYYYYCYYSVRYLPSIRDMMINCSTGLNSLDIINYSDINGGLSLVMDKDLKKLTKFINLVPVCLKVLT